MSSDVSSPELLTGLQQTLIMAVNITSRGCQTFLSSDPLDHTFIPHQPLLISTIKTQMQLL